MNRKFDLWSIARLMPDDGATTTTTATTAGDKGTTTTATTTADKGTTTTADPELAWMTDLPEELRADQTLARYKAKDAKSALGVLASSLITTKRMVSEGSLPMPKTDADKAKVFDALGRPKTAADYAFKPDPKKLETAGLKPQDAATKGWQDLAHKIGLSDDQFKAIGEHYWGTMEAFVGGMRGARDEEYQAGEAALKKAWPGPAYDQNVKIVGSHLAKIAGKMGEDGQAFLDMLDETGLGNEPRFMRFMHAAAESTMSADELKGAHHQSGGMTEAQIDARLAEIKKDKAFTTKEDPSHASIMAEHRRLMAFKHPD